MLMCIYVCICSIENILKTKKSDIKKKKKKSIKFHCILDIFQLKLRTKGEIVQEKKRRNRAQRHSASRKRSESAIKTLGVFPFRKQTRVTPEDCD